MIREPSPMIAGPRTTERSSRAPGAIATRPSTRLASSSSHVDAPLDVLEHEPVGLEHVGELAGVLPPAADVWLSTLDPSSISCWIASVISSSPRPEGSIARAASKIAGVNM